MLPPFDEQQENTVSRKVHGSFFLDYVRMIKNRKDVKWEKHLKPRDLAYLDGQVDLGDWYPLDVYERMGLAILAEVAKGKISPVYKWGRLEAEAQAKRHSDVLAPGTPRETLVRFQFLRRNYFNFEAIRVRTLAHNYVSLLIDYGMSPAAEQAACWQTFGYFERLLELAGATSINCRFTGRRWKGDPHTLLEIDWSNVSADQKVKGVIFLDYVRMIRSRKDIDWKRWLRASDLAMVSEKIDETGWYPMEVFERMGAGILEEIALQNLDAVRLWGRLSVAKLTEAHPDLICPDDPIETLYRFQVLRRSFFNFEAIDINSVHDNYAKLHIDYAMARSNEAAASYQALGFFEQVLEGAGIKGLKSRFVSKSWEGDPATILELKWD